MATRLDALLDEQQRTEIGRRVFDEWARTRPGCPRRPADLVDSVSLADDHVGLFATQWEGRRVVWKSAPSSGQVRPPSPLLPSTIDAWTVDEWQVRQQSDHVVVCTSCNGEGKHGCSTCASNGKVICMECRGARKMYGYAANGARRLLNCQQCRGKGEVDCANCRRGIAVCSTCRGERRVQRWIEIERWSRADTGEHPVELARQYRWTGSTPSFDVERHAAVVTDIERPCAISAADAPKLPRRWIDLLPRAQPGERIVHQRLRIVRIPKLIVGYTVGRRQAAAEFTGLALRPPPGTSSDAFTARASNLRNLAGLMALVFAVVAVLTLARGAFFWSASSAATLAALFVALVFAWLAAAEATARARNTARWAGAALAALLLAGAFTWMGRPTPQHAAQMIAAGDLDAAERELNALGATANETFWADLHLARVAQAADLDTMRREITRIPRRLPQYAAALATYLQFVHKSASDETEKARALTTARERLNARLRAERIWMEWEAASGRSGTPELIALRTAIARDVAILESESR